MSQATTLAPKENAAFAVLSRLISCLVTEQILLAFYTSTRELGKNSGVLVVLSPGISSHPDRSIAADDVFALVLMKQPPVFLNQSSTRYGKRVGLLDPLDMLPGVYGFAANGTDGSFPHLEHILRHFQNSGFDFHGHMLEEVGNPRALWIKLASKITIDHNMSEAIANELDSSFYYQYMAYKNPPRCPSLSSPPIEWEQSLVAGHPTHPMHRTRLMASGLRDYDWYRPLIRFVQVPKGQVTLQGSFEEISQALVTKASSKFESSIDCDQFIYVPVHELQLPNISKLFPTATILPANINIQALAQSSIRTVTVAELPGQALKLAVGVKISSSLRTISHFTADFGPRFSRDVVPRLAFDKNILAIELEPHSFVYRHEDPEVQKHFTAVIRQEYRPLPTETVIVCAALLEVGHSNTTPGVSAVEHVFGLDTELKRIQFLDRYLELSTKAFIPALVTNGVAFEAHAQNVLVRVNKETGTLLGFVIRDLGGMRVHPETLCQSIGADFHFLPEHCIATETLEEIYPKFYHTYVHNHVQRLIRLLDLHHNGVGWEILRKHMAAVIPVAHPVRKLWLSPDSKLVQSKCLMRMRMKDSYRNNVYNPYPNMIQYRPETIDGRRHSSL